MSVLKPIRWWDNNVEDYLSSTATIICEYDILKEDGVDSYFVDYYNRQTEEPTKQATGFKSVEDAKEWCWEHYNIKMKPYLL